MNEPEKSRAFKECPAQKGEPQDFPRSSAQKSRPFPALWLSQLPGCAPTTSLMSLLVAQEQESGDERDISCERDTQVHKAWSTDPSCTPELFPVLAGGLRTKSLPHFDGVSHRAPGRNILFLALPCGTDSI